MCAAVHFPFSTVPIAVGYEFLVYTTSEGQGMVELSVILFDPLTEEPQSEGAPRAFTLSVNTQDGSAGTSTLNI